MIVKPGNIVTANTTDLITINQVEPIYVAFSVPEIQLNSIKNYMGKAPLAVFANPQDSNEPPQQGKLSFIENSVDPTTGTIRLRGTFPNVGRKLWPGQFLRVTLRLATRDDAIIIANQAVQTGQDGSYVYVVKQDRAVESRPIVTGARVGQDLVVEKGLEEGETVVLEGQLRLSPGMKVIVGQRKGGGKKGGGGGPRPEGAPAAEGGAPGGGPAPEAGPNSGKQPRPEGAPAGERPAGGEGRKGPGGPK
jgi:multidrug efflux system membrane fusion protein